MFAADHLALARCEASTGPPSIEGGMRNCLGGINADSQASTGPPSIEGGMFINCKVV